MEDSQELNLTAFDMQDSDIKDLIGIPYETGGRGPNCYDCYGLIKHILNKDGIEIPDYLSPDDAKKVVAIFHSELRLWEETELAHGSILLFRVPGNFHVGYFLEDDQFIHTWKDSGGVVIERLSEWKRRLVGIYKYVG